jgi:hypothetical protein
MSSMRKWTDKPPTRRRPKPHREDCPACGKVRYRDAEEATDALHALLTRAALADQLGGRHTIRVRRKYRCSACQGWHLTSWVSWGDGPAAATV